jgi:3'-phosphoadenosine 5'-phosphosulfate sulfotransferase (PAPS reductase)/FAD synthetase
MKEQEALKLIEEVLLKYDKPVVACSWGKDSIVVLHMVKKVADKLNKRFDVLWNNTTVHYPSVYKLKEKLEKEWNLNIVETKPSMTFWEITEEYGYPGIHSSDRSDKANAACCYNIKKKPTKKAIKENKWDLYFDGLTAYESDRRFMNITEYGLSHHHKTFNLQKVHPVGWWRVKDIWEYIEKYDIPYPDVYDNEIGKYSKLGYSVDRQGHMTDRAIRNGCWCCTLALKHSPEKMEQLREYYPKLWKTLMDKGLAKEIANFKLGGQGDMIYGYFNDKTRDFWLRERPCFFDKI